jgi:hypothetical protein
MYFVDAEAFPLEMLTADEARTVLQGLHAQAAANITPDRALAAQIDEVTAWLDTLAAEEAADAAAEAAAEYASDIHADRLAGML